MGRSAFLLVLLWSPHLLAQRDADPAELDRINAAIARVQTELAGTRSERGALATDIETSEKAIRANLRAIETMRATILQEETTLASLHERQQQLESARFAQQQLIAAYVRSAWMTGNEEYLKLLLNQEDPLHSARMVRYYGYFSAARADRIAAFNRTLAELAVVAAAIESRTLVLGEQQQLLALQQDTLAASQAQRLAVLAHLDADLASRDAELLQLQSDKLEIERLLQELQESIAELSLGEDLEPFAARKGQLIWPLDGRLAVAFGERHALGDLTWEGVTLAADAGADVQAIHHGRVIFADWFNTSGLLLIIDHGDGYMSLYAHNQELYKAVGEWVASGDIIAAVGNTGGQRDSGLYFEIRRNGRAENPASWCKAR